MVKHIVGTSRENCPVVAWLQNKDDSEDRMTLWDGIRAEHWATVAGAAEEIMAECNDGGPHRQYDNKLMNVVFGGGRLICGSQALAVSEQGSAQDAIMAGSLDRALVQLNTLL